MRDFEPRRERERQRRMELEKVAPSQRGRGDLAAEFRNVTEGFETMHERIPDPIMTMEAERRGLDRIDDAARSKAMETTAPINESANKFDVKPDSDVDPGGVDLDLDLDMEGI